MSDFDVRFFQLVQLDSFKGIVAFGSSLLLCCMESSVFDPLFCSLPVALQGVPGAQGGTFWEAGSC